MFFRLKNTNNATNINNDNTPPIVAPAITAVLDLDRDTELGAAVGVRLMFVGDGESVANTLPVAERLLGVLEAVALCYYSSN